MGGVSPYTEGGICIRRFIMGSGLRAVWLCGGWELSSLQNEYDLLAIFGTVVGLVGALNWWGNPEGVNPRAGNRMRGGGHRG